MKFKKKRKIITCMIMALLLTNLAVCYPKATQMRIPDPQESNFYPFYLDMPAHGVLDLATAREKECALNNAKYNLSEIHNPTGLTIYVNVRNSNGGIIVGNAHSISATNGTDYFNVNYKTGYGNVGTYYRPSGQTSSSSTKSAYVSGNWRP